MYEWKITRLERKLEDDVLKSVVIGITCTNTTTGRSAYIDWSKIIPDPENFMSKTKANKKTLLVNHIKNYMADNLHAGRVDEEGVDLPVYTRAMSLKARTDVPVITREVDDSILNGELITGI